MMKSHSSGFQTSVNLLSTTGLCSEVSQLALLAFLWLIVILCFALWANKLYKLWQNNVAAKVVNTSLVEFFWTFPSVQGYEVHVYDSVTNQTTFLGNTTETFFRINSLLMRHNYTFSVQARCLLSGQLCGEPALLLYNQFTAGTVEPQHAEMWSVTKKNICINIYIYV